MPRVRESARRPVRAMSQWGAGVGILIVIGIAVLIWWLVWGKNSTKGKE